MKIKIATSGRNGQSRRIYMSRDKRELPMALPSSLKMGNRKRGRGRAGLR